MKILLIALLVNVVMVDFAKCTPATLCMYRTCTWAGMTCPAGAILQIRDGYHGELSVERWRNMFQEKCSSDNVFCVRTVPGDSGDVYFRYANIERRLPGSDRRTPLNDWCRDKPGVEYWLEV